MTLGDLLVFVAYLASSTGRSGRSAACGTRVAAKAGAERIIEMLDEKPAVIDPVDPAPFARAAGASPLERVSFTYPGIERPALAGPTCGSPHRARSSPWSGPAERARRR